MTGCTDFITPIATHFLTTFQSMRHENNDTC